MKLATLIAILTGLVGAAYVITLLWALDKVMRRPVKPGQD